MVRGANPQIRSVFEKGESGEPFSDHGRRNAQCRWFLRAGAIAPLKAWRAASLIACLFACGRAAEPAGYAVRDSSGVTIVENRTPALAPEDTWTLAAEPHIDIGGRESEAGHDLHEVSGVARLSDGRIVVANGGSRELRFFDANARLLRIVGRTGAGPGEFEAIGRIFLLTGDSLLVIDPSLHRVTLFDAHGSYVRTAVLQPVPGGGAYGPAALLGDGTLLARPGFSFGAHSQTGLYQDTVLLVRYTANGVLADTVGRFPDTEFFVYNEQGRSMAGLRTFGRVMQLAAAPGGFAFGTGERFEFEMRDASGALRQIVRAELPLRPVTEDDLARLHVPTPGEDPAFAAFLRRLLDANRPPSHFPAYNALLADRTGHLWVREYRAWPDDDAAVPWHVFDLQGRWLCAVAVPRELHLSQIFEDEILGVYSDSLDVQHVRAYRLHRNRRR